MDSLPAWAAWIVAIAITLTPGCLFLSDRPIGRFLGRTLWPHLKGAPQLGPERTRDEAAIAAPPG
jgi:hypothetical protein